MAKMGRLAISPALLTLLALGACCRAGAADPPAPPAPPEVQSAPITADSVRRIWDHAPHNAFTDILRHDGQLLCVFREGSAHIPGTDGVIRVLASRDGAAWESRATLAEAGVDLRDPKLSLAPDGRLVIVMGGSYYDGKAPTPGRKRAGAHSRVSFSKDGAEWTPPAKVEGLADDQWLWRLTWHKGTGYATVYGPARNPAAAAAAAAPTPRFAVYRTVDGIHYDHPIDTAVPADGDEATARFLPDDTMVILFRGAGKTPNAYVGTSKPPYDHWQWADAGRRAQGPNFIVLDDGRMLYAGRDFDSGTKAPKTVVGWMTASSLSPALTLPSGGDTSYPGLLMNPDGSIWMTYYASHERHTAIYLAHLTLPNAGK